MNISYSNWQQIDLTKFDRAASAFTQKFSSSSNVLSEDGNASVSSFSNTSIKGSWVGYTFTVTGNGFKSGSSIVELTSLSFKNSTEAFKIAGSVSYNIYSEQYVAGQFNNFEYSNKSGTKIQMLGGFMLDQNDNFINSKVTSLSVTFSGYTLAFTGDLTLNSNGDVTSGTVNSISFTERQGRKLVISGISEDFNYLDSLTGNVSSLSGLYNALNFSGNDTITAGATNDILDGGTGVDVLIGGKGNDTYYVDLLASGSFEDTVIEAKNAGIDTINLRGDIDLAGTFTINLAKDIESINAQDTADTLLNFVGNASANVITGNDANNVIEGGAGKDTLNGGAGADTLNGGKDKDILNGGAGNDNLTGGAGADTFVFKLADIGSAGAPSNDTITDFSVKLKDVLDLRDLLPSANENDMAGLLTYIDVTTDGSNTQLHISATGGFTAGVYDAASENATITLNNVNLLAGTDESTLLQTLINKNQLLID